MKFLLVRLSSMGDVILTTPAIRALHNSYPQAEIHFLTKKAYEPLLLYHPLLQAVHSWPPSTFVCKQKWEGVIDLQRSLRTLPLRWRLRYMRYTTFPKKNVLKWIMVRQKRLIPLPHVVKRYGEALRPFGVSQEELGPIEVYFPPSIIEKVEKDLRSLNSEGGWLAVGIGGTYATKRWPIPYYETLLNRLEMPVILLGGATEAPQCFLLAKRLKVPAVIGAGRYSLLETAAAIKLASLLLTHDTGTAHLGAAMQTPTLVLWGNTVPEFGMTPWHVPYANIETRHLRCRPCSKLGFSACPQGHHDCMRSLTPDYVEKRIRSFYSALSKGKAYKIP
ncbi:MAG: glycosyltransferase family 9 protein [Bacteroidia bacterium]|nr:glycosyltransferase family 9 protein [Bacteroidia bacterium]MDW8014757.1 glycosyltransferase family 9 protein [Bacteroidia bacterium]